jgi:glutathione-regulated potassium-efflux system protein KefB
VRFAVDTFMAADRRRLYEDYKHYTDIEKMQELAKSHTQELEELFARDAEEQAKREPGEKATRQVG